MNVSKKHILKYNPLVLDGLLIWLAFFIGEVIRCELLSIKPIFSGIALMGIFPSLIYVLFLGKSSKSFETDHELLTSLFKAISLSFLVVCVLILSYSYFSISGSYRHEPTIPTAFFQFIISLTLLIAYRVLLVVREQPSHRPSIVNDLASNIKSTKVQPSSDASIYALLNRPEIHFNSTGIAQEIQGETIFISGGAGSIGNEIVRQVGALQPKKVIVLDQAETAIHYLELELEHVQEINVEYQLIIGDITDRDRLEEIFSEHKPTIIFHAAAYKHVPLMESNPQEAFNVNVLGTKNLADISIEHGIKKFIMVSTDKAINPTNIMGATKRLAEIYVQGLSRNGSRTQFITTRFGNVLGSNGSVVPLFNRQIENGGPVTITHEAITRYFMTLPEACNLVLEAAAMGNGGEIFVFDMGEPIKVHDLALKLIRLHGLRPDKDIKIKFTGLRAGEKLYEEPWSMEENTVPTAHAKIMKAYIREEKFEMITKRLELVHDKISTFDKKEVFLLLTELVPEFKTNNDQFLKFDQSPPPWDEISSQ